MSALRSDLTKTAIEINEIVDEAAFDTSHWHRVTAALADAVPGSKPSFVLLDDGAARTLPMIWHGWDDAVVKSFCDHFSHQNPWAPGMHVAREMVPISSERTLPASRFRHTAFYTDWLRPAGEVDAATGVKVLEASDRSAFFSLHYDAARSDRLVDSCERLLAAVAPNMRRSLAASRAQVTRTANRTDTDLVEALAEPALLVDAAGVVLHGNAAADHLLADAAPLAIGERGVATLPNRVQQRELQRRIDAACTLKRVADLGADDLVVGPQGTHALVILPVRQKLRAFDGMAPLFVSQGRAIVVIRPRRNHGAVARHRMMHDWGLTEREAAICSELLGGKGVWQIADAMGVSYETVRTHLKRVYAKTGAHRQAELVTLLQGGI